VYDYQFPTAVKARRANVDAEDRKVRAYDASKQAAYVTSESVERNCLFTKRQFRWCREM